VQVEYALQCCKKIQEENIKAIEVKQESASQINEHIDAWHSSLSLWAEECRWWYKGNKGNGRVHIWPGTLLRYLETLKTPRFEHYNISYWVDNMWGIPGQRQNAT
jgi:hypothetical protein